MKLDPALTEEDPEVEGGDLITVAGAAIKIRIKLLNSAMSVLVPFHQEVLCSKPPFLF
jgi:hypothetical protein